MSLATPSADEILRALKLRLMGPRVYGAWLDDPEWATFGPKVTKMNMSWRVAAAASQYALDPLRGHVDIHTSVLYGLRWGTTTVGASVSRVVPDLPNRFVEVQLTEPLSLSIGAPKQIELSKSIVPSSTECRRISVSFYPASLAGRVSTVTLWDDFPAGDILDMTPTQKGGISSRRIALGRRSGRVSAMFRIAPPLKRAVLEIPSTPFREEGEDLIRLLWRGICRAAKGIKLVSQAGRTPFEFGMEAFTGRAPVFLPLLASAAIFALAASSMDA